MLCGPAPFHVPWLMIQRPGGVFLLDWAVRRIGQEEQRKEKRAKTSTLCEKGSRTEKGMFLCDLVGFAYTRSARSARRSEYKCSGSSRNCSSRGEGLGDALVSAAVDVARNLSAIDPLQVHPYVRLHMQSCSEFPRCQKPEKI